MIKGKWYITRTAVLHYMAIRGDPDTPEAFHDAAGELQRLSNLAHFVREYGTGKFEGWRVKALVNGKQKRLNLSVSIAQRDEGYQDQLVAVADNDRR